MADYQYIYSMQGVGKVVANKKEILKDIYLSFLPGAKIGVLGLNGSGKSTILKLLMNMVKPQKGSIFIDSYKVDELDVSSILTYVHQDDHIFNDDYKKNVTLYNAYNINELEKSFTKLNSLDKLRHAVNCQKLSGGEKQIVSYMRAILKNTDIVLMDEPFSSVDTVTEEHLLRQVLESSKTIILVTHKVTVPMQVLKFQEMNLNFYSEEV